MYFTPKAFSIYVLEYRATSISTFYTIQNKGPVLKSVLNERVKDQFNYKNKIENLNIIPFNSHSSNALFKNLISLVRSCKTNRNWCLSFSLNLISSTSFTMINF